jgi:hypothetical protein
MDNVQQVCCCTIHHRHKPSGLVCIKIFQCFLDSFLQCSLWEQKNTSAIKGSYSLAIQRDPGDFVCVCWCVLLTLGSRFVRWSHGIQKWWQPNVLLELTDHTQQLQIISRRSCIRYALVDFARVSHSWSWGLICRPLLGKRAARHNSVPGRWGSNCEFVFLKQNTCPLDVTKTNTVTRMAAVF